MQDVPGPPLYAPNSVLRRKLQSPGEPFAGAPVVCPSAPAVHTFTPSHWVQSTVRSHDGGGGGGDGGENHSVSPTESYTSSIVECNTRSATTLKLLK